jgi:hypothetical protein
MVARLLVKPVAKFIVPDWGNKVNPMPESTTYIPQSGTIEEYTNICGGDVFSIRWLLTDWHINPLKHTMRLSYIIGGFSPHLLAHYICTTNILISLCVLHTMKLAAVFAARTGGEGGDSTL